MQKSRESGLQMGRAGRNRGRQSRKLQKHRSPSRVMKYGILLQSLRNIFRKGDTFLHNENRPFPLHNNPAAQHSNACLFPSCFTQLCIDVHSLSKLMRYTGKNFWTVGTCLSSVCPHSSSQRTAQKPTHIASETLKCHQIGNMTKTPTGLPGIWGVTILSDSAHHHGPHSLSTCYVNRAGQLECRSCCNTWRSVLHTVQSVP